MSETTADFAAAAHAFEAIFKEVDKTTQKKCWQSFVRGYKEAYTRTRAVLADPKTGERFQFNVEQSFFEVATNLRHAQGAGKLDEAIWRGWAFGEFLATIDFAIAQYWFQENLDNTLFYERVIGQVQEIARLLASLDKQISRTYLAARLRKIAKAHAGELNPRHQAFLVKIATAFVK